MNLPYAEPFKIKMVEPIKVSTRAEREKWVAEAHYNLFALPSEQVYIDLLTDSGTGAMSDRQWGAIMTGDESYAGSRSYYRLKETIKNIFGFPYIMPAHQGRAAENLLFSALIKEGDITPGNSHFDTTKGHIEYRKAHAIDCTIDEAFVTDLEHPFKGNVDLNKLKKVFDENPHDKIPFIIVTVTNNTAGGQPVSLENLRAVKEFANSVKKPVLFDSARFAENAYFIKTREKGFENLSIREIVLEMYKCADMMTMSSKKDAIVNIGGFIAMNSEELWQKLSVLCVIFEGYVTYGGMAGRDMEALAVGLEDGTDFEYLKSRISQVEYLGKQLIDYGIPIQRPVGGHAVFVDALKFLPNLPREQYVAQTLVLELYLEAGIRGVEIGTLLADRDPETRKDRYPALELVRLAIPRRTYTYNHMDVVAAALKNIWDRRESITKGYKIDYEAPIMRHFTIKMSRV